MKFVTDESLDFPIVTALRKTEHDMYSIREESPRMSDDQVLKIANSQKRILLTGDKDFGELVFRLKLVSSGIILLRLPELSNQKKTEIVTHCIEQHQDKLKSSFCVITSGKVRLVKI